MVKKVKESLWLDRALFVSPYYYRLCLTEKEFHKELKRLKLPHKDWSSFLKTTHADATLHYFTNVDGNQCAIVCIGDREGRSITQIYALLVHEAVHLFQAIKESCGEYNPSVEFEAYAIQSLSQRLMESYEYQTKKKGKKCEK